ncbi:unnamed protein product, partial [Urochloa humidicola]
AAPLQFLAAPPLPSPTPHSPSFSLALSPVSRRARVLAAASLRAGMLAAGGRAPRAGSRRDASFSGTAPAPSKPRRSSRSPRALNSHRVMKLAGSTSHSPLGPGTRAPDASPPGGSDSSPPLILRTLMSRYRISSAHMGLGMKRFGRDAW